MSSEAEPVAADVDERADSSPYVVGEATYRKYARLETKPPDEQRTGGYERFRSYEDLETQPGGKRDVYCYHHRLLALLHPDVVDEPIDEAIAHLSRREVHHRNGVKWDNRIENFDLETKSDHSSITRQDQLAFAHDAKRQLEEEGRHPPGADECDGCGAVGDDLATIDGVDGEYCLECALERANGKTIQF